MTVAWTKECQMVSVLLIVAAMERHACSPLMWHAGRLGPRLVRVLSVCVREGRGRGRGREKGMKRERES